MNPTNWNQIRLNEIIRTYTNSKVATNYGFCVCCCCSSIEENGNTMRQLSHRHYKRIWNWRHWTQRHEQIFERKAQKKRIKKNHIPLFWKPYIRVDFFFFYRIIFLLAFRPLPFHIGPSLWSARRMKRENIIAIVVQWPQTNGVYCGTSFIWSKNGSKYFSRTNSTR